MKRFLQLAVLLLLFGFAAGQADVPKVDISNMSKKLPVDPDVKIGKLDNGITYYIRKNQKPEEYAHFRIVFSAGAIQEDDDQNGLAHFTEHMCFNGTKNFPENKLIEVLQKAGVRFGADLNASTGYDQTMYELPIPMNNPELLENAFQILEDWSHNVLFEGKDIDDERGVIINEWRQRNNAGMRLNDKHAPKLFYGSKFAKRNVIGDTAIILNFEHDVIRRFYKDWYRSDLMAVVAVGDFDVADMEKRIKKYFSRIQPVKNPRKHEIYPVPNHKETFVSIASDPELTTDQVAVYIKHDKKESVTYNDYRESLKEQMINSMFGDRFREVTQKPDAPFLGGSAFYTDYLGDKSMFMVSVGTEGGKSMQGLEGALDEVHRVLKHGFTEAELKVVKNEILANYESYYNERKGTQHRSYVGEYTRNFIDKEAMPGIEWEYGFTAAVLPTITIDEINQLAKSYFRNDNTVITLSLVEGHTFPTENQVLALYKNAANKDLAPYEAKEVADVLFNRNVTPGKIVATKENKEVGFTEFTLSNGAKVVIKSTDFSDDEVLFAANSRGGVSLASKEDYFTSAVAGQFVPMGGIADFSMMDLQKVLAGKNASVRPMISEMSEGFRGQSTQKDIETMLQLVNLYFTAPRKDDMIFQAVKQQFTGMLAQRSNNPQSAFQDTMGLVMSGYHYTATPPSVEMINSVDYDKAIQFFKDRYANAGDFTFYFVGNVDANQLKPMIEKYIASLPGNDKKENWKDMGIKTPREKITKRFKNGNEDRTMVYMAITGDFDWSQESRHRIRSMVEVLDIRFTQEIREKLGGVYSPGVWVTTEKYPNPEYKININFVCEPSRTDELVAASEKLLNEMKSTLEEESTDKVIKAQLGERVRDIKTNQYWLNSLTNAYLNDEPVDGVLTYEKYINNLTAKDVQKAAQKYINLDHLVKVIMEPTTVKN